VVALKDIAALTAPDSVSSHVIVDVAETVRKGFVIVIVAVWRRRRSPTAVSGALRAQSHRLTSLYSFESASEAETIGEIGVNVGASEKAKAASEGFIGPSQWLISPQRQKQRISREGRVGELGGLRG
jgi:hypothetical protein